MYSNTKMCETNLFNKECEFMDRIFYKYQTMRSIYKKKREEMKSEMPEYMSCVCGIYCKDCAEIMSLNGFLNKWRVFINNREEFLYYKEYIVSMMIKTIENITERFSYYQERISLGYLCGCKDYDRYDKENIEWDKYIRETNGQGNEGYIIIDNLSSNSRLSKERIKITCNTSDEFKSEFKRSLIWRNDLNNELDILKKHLKYFKIIPHNSYRNILVKITLVTNSDCVKNIIEYL